MNAHDGNTKTGDSTTRRDTTHVQIQDGRPPGSPTARTPSAHRAAALIARRPIAAFMGWFFTVGQAIAFIPVVARAGYDTELNAAPFLITAAFLGLLLPAIAITWITDGSDGVRALRTRALTFRVPARWHVAAVVGVPAVSIAGIAAMSGWPGQIDGATVASAYTLGVLLQLVVVFVTVNWAEEIAWMGFVQARLQGRHGAARAALLTAPMFAFGHISQLVGDSFIATFSVLVLMIVICVPFRALLAWVYNHTGSLALVGLVHAAANATAAGSILGTGLLERLYPGEGQGGVVIPILAVVGLIVLIGTRGRLGLSARRPDGHSFPHPVQR